MSTATAGVRCWAWWSALGGPSRSGPEFLLRLTRRGPRGVKLVVSVGARGQPNSAPSPTKIEVNVLKLAAIRNEAQRDVAPAYMTFPKEHRAKLHSINPIERINAEIKRRRFGQPGPTPFAGGEEPDADAPQPLFDKPD